MCLICGKDDGIPACRKCRYIIIGGRGVVGEVDPLRKEYYSRRVWKEHYFRMWEGWGLSACILQTLLSDKYRRWVKWVVLGTDVGVFRANIADFLRHGKVYFDGKDKQYVLQDCWFKKLLL